jgi:hypothetical protein
MMYNVIDKIQLFHHSVLTKSEKINKFLAIGSFVFILGRNVIIKLLQ